MNEYVGIPYKAGGRDRDGCDCYGLVRLVLRERFGKEMPEYGECISHGADESYRLISDDMPLVDAFRPDVPQAGDVVVLKMRGQPSHIGVYLGGGKMLHTLAEHDSAIESVDGPKWVKRIEGYYRVR